MHDFDYDAMQKKRIARGAMNMKRGSKSKKCSLPHDGWTAAQLRRLNGPVRTYKLDEPMDWVSFKAMPEDLKKHYITRLQETYQANDKMLSKMFGVSRPTLLKMRGKLGISVIEDHRLYGKDKEIRDAKWEAFCNGVVGGKPGEQHDEIKEEAKVEETESNEETQYVSVDDVIKIDTDNPIPGVPEYVNVSTANIVPLTPAYTPVPARLDVTFVEDIADHDDITSMINTLNIPTGKCRIRISIERC